MELNIDNRITNEKKNNCTTLIISSNDTLQDVKIKIKKNLGISLDLNRIGLFFETEKDSKKSKILLSSNNKKISEYGIKDGSLIIIKDLGFQMKWRTVYIIEYLGPLLISILFFWSRGHFNGPFVTSIAFLMIAFHYSKRIIESIYVHEFSRDTMPIKNLFVNCAYYWILFGVLCCSSIFSPSYNTSAHFLGNFRFVFALFFFLSQLKNLKCHLIQKKLKEDNKGERGIPTGEGFELVSCANYFWEFISWLNFAFYTGHWSSFLFCFTGLFIMSKWAIEKHSNYKKTFANYPKNRKAIIPYIL